MNDELKAEPMAYAVMHSDSEYDYRIYPTIEQAELVAADVPLEEGDEEPQVIPLYQLAEHPADGDTLIDEAWLRSVGYSPVGSRYWYSNIEQVDRNEPIISWDSERRQINVVGLDRKFPGETRNQLRALCSALGVAIKG